MRPEDRIRLQHMLQAADTAIQFKQGRERSALDDDRMLLFAVIRAVEVLGEAASRVSSETREFHKDLPWRAATSMRNRLIHGYFDIDKDILWATVDSELPALSISMQAGSAYLPNPISPIFTRHSAGPVVCTDCPVLSTATVTGMSTTSNS